MHPADEIRGETSKRLLNKKIIFGVTGSIAAVETIRLCRELIRHGADIYPVMTSSAMKILHPDSLWFAAGRRPIIDLTGDTEHVAFCGETKERADLFLVSPCTANTLSKIALGIDDTPVTTFASTAIGASVPVLLVPAMHVSMYRHKSVQRNIQKCKDMGITVLDPRIEGTKAKIANQEEIILQVFRLMTKNDLANTNVLIVGGPTAESIDSIRVLTNRSSGKTAVYLARNAFERGAAVELWYGPTQEPIPPGVTVKRFESITDILQMLKESCLKDFDVILVCAAIADYLPKKQTGKILSGKKGLILPLSPAPKIIKKLRTLAPNAVLVAFKAEETKSGIAEKASVYLKTSGVDMVVANTLSGFGNNENEIWMVHNKSKPIHINGNKKLLAEKILDRVKKIV